MRRPGPAILFFGRAKPKDKTFAPRRHRDTEGKHKWAPSGPPDLSGSIKSGSSIFRIHLPIGQARTRNQDANSAIYVSLRVSVPPWCKGLWFLHSKPAGFTINTLQHRLSRKFRFPTMTLSLNHCRIISALFLLLALPVLADDDIVRTESGSISGTAGTHPGVRVYRGIPFAAPPTGDLRWKAPQPVTPWKAVREAKEFGSACLQKAYPEGSIYHAQLPKMSEDCLTLNVWTAAKTDKERRPVMVWIYGGGFTRGASSISAYDGEKLAEKGVVLVSVNYRLGVFGLFAHPELTAESEHHASGNYAMLDQIAALRWVRKNIEAFGGDPKRVTIFGESAGSEAVSVLVASPQAKGLFTRAIGESGAAFFPMTSLAEAEKAGQTAAEAQGATKDAIKTLRAKSGDDLLKTMDAEKFSQPAVHG